MTRFTAGTALAGATAAGAGLFWMERRRRRAKAQATGGRSPSLTVSRAAGSVATAWDIWHVGHGTPADITARQQARLTDLVAAARSRSPYYAELYGALPRGHVDLTALPVVTKPELMAHFDEWGADPALTRAGVEAFVADPARIGERYLGRYTVWTSSGTTGRPGIFVHDRAAMALYYTLGMLRAPSIMGLVTPGQLRSFLLHGSRNALLAVTGGHFVGASETERLRRRAAWLANSGRIFSVLRPLPELVRALNEFQPTRIGGYPTALALLADEQLVGRLRISPQRVTPSGEWLSPAARARLEYAFGCPVRSVYSASEFMGIAYECGQGWLHASADWVILEPVDAEYRPVPPGQPSHTVLLTNLANRVQPLIRYDLGDSVTLRPDPCPCGSPLPALRVEGRTSDTLRLLAPSGASVAVPPLAISTVVEETAGVRRAQLIQTGPREISVRLEAADGADASQVWAEVARRLRVYLDAQGLSTVSVERAVEPPQVDPISGKFRQVWCRYADDEPAATSAVHEPIRHPRG